MIVCAKRYELSSLLLSYQSMACLLTCYNILCMNSAESGTLDLLYLCVNVSVVEMLCYSCIMTNSV